MIDPIEVAKRCALKSNMLHKHGAVVICPKGKIIGSGYNRTPTGWSNGLSCHAEMDAMSALRGRGRFGGGCRHDQMTLMVVRVGPDGELKLSEPCQHCKESIAELGIKKIFFSTSPQPVFDVKKI